MQTFKKIFLFSFFTLLSFIILPKVAEAATFTFTPSNQNYIQNCTNEVSVMIDTQGSQSNAADIQINYNTSQIVILDSNAGIPGVQVQNGDAYEAYVYNNVDTINGIIKVATGSFVNNLNGTKTFLKIQFKANVGVLSSGFTINFTGIGNTLDSNIAEATTNNDLLTSVTNGNYTFGTGSCAVDLVGPTITFINPTNGETGVPGNAILNIGLSDSFSGVNINTLEVTVNGVTYTPVNPELTYTGSPANYNLNLDPITDIPNSTTTIIVRVADNAGNYSISSITINVPPGPSGTPAPSPFCPTGTVITPVTGSTSDLVKTIENILLQQEFLPPVVKDIIREIGLPGLLSGFVFLPFFITILSLLPLLLSPQLLYTFFAALFGGKQKVWGIVYDKETKKPIPFATVKLYTLGTTAFIIQKVTDLDGRYGFVLSKGSYRLEVAQSDYHSFSKEITIRDDEKFFAEDIPLIKLEHRNIAQRTNSFFYRVRIFSFKYSLQLSILGFIFSLIALIVAANTLNLILTLVYGVLLFLSVLFKIRNRRRNWGVIESTDGTKIAGATVRIFDPQKSLSDTQITDNNGRFGFLVEPGTYNISVNAIGYNFPSNKQTDLQKNAVNPGLIEVKVDKTKWLRLKLFLDPVKL